VLDGWLCDFVPSEVTNCGWFRNNMWLHTDQSPLKKGLHCIQSWVNLEDTGTGDATLCFWDNSRLVR
jgi:hypothetical protein